jgi:hypothetical protein
MMQRKNCLVFMLFSLVVSGTTIFGQTNEDRLDKLKNMIPPSPNAAALGKYGDWPVNQYTGLPNISIPIYDFKEGGVSIPVSISYHSSGNKVGDIASWVGLGWSLNCGGIISRSVRGFPDENQSDGYFIKKQLYQNPDDLCSQSTPSNLTLATQHKVNAANGISDSEQDVYSFNALGKSFSFFIKADGTIVPRPYSKVKVKTNFHQSISAPEDVYWSATLEDGTILEFGGLGYLEMNSNPRFDIGASHFPTAWLLKRIKGINGEIINFSYNVVSIDQDSYFSESDFLKYKIQQLNASQYTCSDYISSIQNRIKTERQQVTMLQVSLIESQSLKVEFEQELSARHDLKGGRALSKIKIISKHSNSIIESFVFNYVYSQCVGSIENWQGVQTVDQDYYRKRLKLTSLEKRTANNLLHQKWGFRYNPVNLPSRRSFAQDHWGFYNGKVNSNTLLPKFFFPLTPAAFQMNQNAGFNLPIYKEGVDRDGNENFALAEILEGIDYPTGGKTDFYFEGNRINLNEEIFNKVSTNALQINVTANSNPIITSNDYVFTITKAQNIKLSLNSYISSNLFLDMPNVKVSASIIRNSNQTVISGISSTLGQSSFSNEVRFNLLDPGSYTLRINSNCSQASFGDDDIVEGSAFLEFEQSQGIQNVNKNTGGLRLQRMITYDAFDTFKNVVMLYQYENPLILSPIDIRKSYFAETEEYSCEVTYPGNGVIPPGYLGCHNKIITRNSSTKYSLGSIQGGTVGYGKVTVLYGYGGINGKKISIFSNEQDSAYLDATEFPHVPTNSRDWRRGNLLKDTIYNSSGVIIATTENVYQYDYRDRMSFFKAGVFVAHSNNSICTMSFCNNPYGDCGILKTCYSISSEQVKLISTVQKTFDANGLNPRISTTFYFYDNPNNLNATRTEFTDSKGLVLKTINRGPLDKSDVNTTTALTPTASLAIDSMLARNIISSPVQQIQYRNNILTQLSLINYKLWGNNIIQPENVEVKVGANPLEQRVAFNKYDVSGNLQEQQKINDVKQVYLYDYKNTYPIAQVINADSALVAYTSFEADGLGTWVNIDPARNNTFAMTGTQSYNLTTGKSFTKLLPAGNRQFIVSYWSRNGAVTVTINGNTTTAIPGVTKNGWTYYSHLLLTGTNVSVTATNAIIDELRLYPSDAQMTTYTYLPLIGMSSTCSPNNYITYYEYDNFNRLKVIRDMDKKIIKMFDYQYQTYAHGSPVWQTVSGPTCELLAGNNTGNQITVQQDVNPQSASFGQSQNVVVSNTTACPTNSSITCRNFVAVAGYTARFTNTTTNTQYNFPIGTAMSLQTLGTIPAGNYNLSFLKTGASVTYVFGFFCGPELSGTTPVNFYNITIGGATCNSIFIDSN